MRNFIANSPYFLFFCLGSLGLGLIFEFFFGKILMLICLELACLRFYSSSKFYLIFSALGLNLILSGIILDATGEITAPYISSENLTRISVLNILILLGILLKILAFTFLENKEKKWLGFIIMIFICSYIFIFTLKFTNLQGNLLFLPTLKYLLIACVIYLSSLAIISRDNDSFGSNFVLINFCCSLFIILYNFNNLTIATLYFLTNSLLLLALAVISWEEEKNINLSKPMLWALVVIYLSMIGMLPNINLFAKDSFTIYSFTIILGQATALVPAIKIIKRLW